ncbi:hypothetical protein CDL12_02209 [Handroanthus impetiginosus]|uniref:Calponin-homology (CH) domain-containing protein n=1 Tax=Handroanthus impetiginosus TaxID=429701 RepID=A0A2G9I5M2_9LAMI|nr:hypothetical protein CDL12_02209 [Handroanthus impetiginosus]
MIDSSPSSAESSFRELDEAFLQTQTRIWLGEVLNTRLDEDLHISDLLQDGEILYEVSKVVWNLLLTKCMELRHLRHKYGPFGSKKSSGKYRPYSNVDSFLKICKILGLSGIDLFSPSDVVEKRNIRKVCICIRALSKKARSKQLSVPDFDMVVYSVAMPTDMVGVLRRSLESSQCTLSSSSSYSFKSSQMKLKQKNLYAQSNRDDDTSSEGSDEAESRYMGETKFDYADGVNSDIESSTEAYSISGQYRRKKHDLILALFCRRTTVISRDCRKGADISNLKSSFENDDSVVGDSSCINVGENNYISDYLAFSDLMVHAADGNNPALLDGENNMFDFFLNVDSEGLTSDKRSFKNGSHRKFSDDEDMEVSFTTSMSSVLGRLLNLEFDDQFDEDDSLSAYGYSSASKEHESEKQYKDSFVISQIKYESCGTQMRPENDFCLENVDMIVAYDDRETLCHEDGNEAAKTTVPISDSHVLQYEENHYSQVTSPVVSDKTNIQSSIVQANLSETILDNDSHIPVKDTNGAHIDAHKSSCTQVVISSSAENGGQDKGELIPIIEEESISDEEKHSCSQLPPAKHSRKPLLKTVVKGTAIAGVLFLLLHISRKSKGNNAQEN